MVALGPRLNLVCLAIAEIGCGESDSKRRDAHRLGRPRRIRGALESQLRRRGIGRVGRIMLHRHREWAARDVHQIGAQGDAGSRRRGEQRDHWRGHIARDQRRRAASGEQHTGDVCLDAVLVRHHRVDAAQRRCEIRGGDDARISRATWRIFDVEAFAVRRGVLPSEADCRAALAHSERRRSGWCGVKPCGDRRISRGASAALATRAVAVAISCRGALVAQHGARLLADAHPRGGGGAFLHKEFVHHAGVAARGARRDGDLLARIRYARTDAQRRRCRSSIGAARGDPRGDDAAGDRADPSGPRARARRCARDAECRGGIPCCPRAAILGDLDLVSVSPGAAFLPRRGDRSA